MIITYQGLESFKVQFADTVLSFNPPSKESEHKSPRFGADIVLVSLWDKDFNGVLSFGDKTPFVISEPGEYDVKGVSVLGVPSVSRYGGVERINTIYLVTLEEMNLCFLGALSSKEIPPESLEALEDIDVLFVPIGGNGVLTPVDAYNLSVGLEPGMIIPMHFDSDGKALKTFLKEGGEEGARREDKLTLKKRDLEGKEGDIILLLPAYA